VPFYVAAPTTTVDLATRTGADIRIEERDAAEIATWDGGSVVPDGAGVYNPAFDVTPAHLVTALITERGVLHHPDTASIATHVA
jgi:methylthioribose-1-phosphate isomerase